MIARKSQVPASISTGIETRPPPPMTIARGGGDSVVHLIANNATAVAAEVLAEHLFAQTDANIPGISYAVTYKLAEGHVGGDLIDVYHFDNDSVAISIADIAGKGTQAAVHAAMIKYGLRAYASQGLTPERVLRSLDRLYLENNAFERTDSFASVFFGHIDPSRRLLHYASAAHQPVMYLSPTGDVRILEPTAPLVGVFDDQHHLFKQGFLEVESGGTLVATTDGVTEARDRDGNFFGMPKFIETVRKNRHRSEREIVELVVGAAEKFCGGRRRDDIAILAVRFA